MYQPPKPKGRTRLLVLAALCVVFSSVALDLDARGGDSVAFAADIPATTKGASCKVGNKWGTYQSTSQPRPANGALSESLVRCYLNPANTTNGNSFMAFLATFTSHTTTFGNTQHLMCGSGGGTGCGVTANIVATNSPAYLPGAELTAWGDLVRGDGTLVRVESSSSLPDNYVEFTIRGGFGSGSAGYNMYGTDGVGGSFNYACLGTPCATANQLGGIGMPMVAEVTAGQNDTVWGVWAGSQGLIDWISGDPSMYPDKFAGQTGFPNPACYGVTFDLLEDGVALTKPISGTWDPAKTYRLRLTVPTTTAAGTLTVYFDADRNGDSLGATAIGTITTPVTSTNNVRSFDVYGHYAALADDTPELGELRAVCQQSGLTGNMTWTGGTGNSINGIPEQTDDWPESDEVALSDCFTFDGMSLTNPVSWVRGIGTMLVCIARWAFIPTDAQMATFTESIDALTADPPLQWIAEGITFANEASFTFGTWSTVGPQCVEVLDVETCPGEWDNGIAVPTWLVSVLLFGLWTSVIVLIWRFFS